MAAGLEAASFRHGLGAQFMDVNGDGRPDLYVANDEDPNDLYVNVPWPGGAAADPTGLGFRFEERAADGGVADPFAGMGIAAGAGRLLVTNSRGEPSAAYRRDRRRAVRRTTARTSTRRSAATSPAGAHHGSISPTPDGSTLVLTAGAIPVTSLKEDAEAVRVLAPNGNALGHARTVVSTGLKLNGRGLAVADAWNDGRQEIAINTIGGNLVLLQPTAKTGHWLDVALTRFSPGAVVTVVLPNGSRQSAEVHAGSSYLSSEDPRVHFGLGSATRVDQLIVKFPSGTFTRLSNVPADRVVSVLAPKPPAVRPEPMPPPKACRVHASDAWSLRRPNLERRRRRDARGRAHARPSAGARSLPALNGRLARVRRGAIRRARRGDQLRRLPAPSLAGVIRRQPLGDVRPARTADSRPLLLAGATRSASETGLPPQRSRPAATTARTRRFASPIRPMRRRTSR